MADVVAAVCSGEVQVGLLAQSSLLDTRSPGCPERPLSAVPLEDATFWFGIGANKKLPMARAAADRLRSEWRMADDGSLAGIDFRWHTSIGTEASTIFQYGRLRFLFRTSAGRVRGSGAGPDPTFWLMRRLRAAQTWPT